ncbi:CheR family methyltransferase [Geotalea toluenoxydans]
MQMPFSVHPSLASKVAEERLAHLLVPGKIEDHDLDLRISRLDRLFHCYATSITHGLWVPGLVITHEMQAFAELLFPLDRIIPVFNRFFAKATLFTPFLGASAIHSAPSWPDALHELQSLVTSANPAELLRSLLADEKKRRHFFFLNFLPPRYGGGFNRYPKQLDFLKDWLRENRRRFNDGINCLDAACGCGEGTYELAALLLDCGHCPETFHICGSTIEPFELFAAAHVFFPHDLQRQANYQRHVAPLFSDEISKRMAFRLEDIVGTPATAERFHAILCNGILGGPFLHEKVALEKAVAGLAARLNLGGILLAADKFHGGWKKKAPATLLVEIFTKAGLEVLKLEEGLAGIKTG